MWIFLGAIALVALLGVFDFLRPNWGQVVKNGIPQVDALGNPKMDVFYPWFQLFRCLCF